MHKKKIAAVTMAMIISNFSATTLKVLAYETSNNTSKLETNNNNGATNASISKFDLYNSDKLDSYNEAFKMDNSNISSITNNGGKYSSSSIDKAIDGSLSTHWETGQPNNSEFTNEVIFTLNELTNLNRIVYAARQDGAKGKGFAQQLEIYASLTDEGDDFRLVSTGEYKGSTGDLVEIKFNSTEFKRIKFKFKKANQDWASASEFMFYKEDEISDKVKILFTDSTKSSVSEEFNTVNKINSLEEEVKNHPLYEDYKEDIDNARTILSSNKIEATKAKVSKLTGYGTDKEKEYDAKYMMPNYNISNIEANGGTYPTTKLEYMLDGKANTHWETNKNNSNEFTNELIFTLDKAEVLDRIGFLAREVNQKGFPEEFEIYASETSKGDTFQLVSSGESTKTSDFLEFKFEPTKFKRIKFKFKKAVINRPFVAEMRFYKQDVLTEKYNNLFINDSKNTLSEEFNTLEKLTTFENELKNHPMYDIYKEDIENAKLILENKEVQYVDAKVSKFEEMTNENISKYDEKYKLPLAKITKITNNGRHYGNNVINNLIDGDITTNWHSGDQNSDSFTNEVVMELDELTTLNRIVYTHNRGTNRGFAEEFEIYASRTSKGDTFEKVSTGSMTKTQDTMEIRFNPTEFKRVKFVYKKGYENWACASEFGLYKQDELSEKMDRLFTDSSMSKVSDEFNSLDKIQALENEVNSHPMASMYKEDIENAKILVSKGKIEATTALTSKFDHYDNEKYSELFRMPLSNIKSIKNNAGHWASQVINNAVDGNLDTYWETNKGNDNSFNNEVEVEFKEAVTLNRVVYGARQSDRKGFAQEFEIYGSRTSKGDTYELVAKGKHDKTTGQVEAKFNPTEFKRLKFKFVKSDQNWATLNEISFYTEDKLADKIANLFTNGLMNELNPAYSTMEAISKLEEEADKHPLKDSYRDDIKLAKSLLNNENTSNSSRVVTAEQRGKYQEETRKRSINGALYSSMESIGRYVTAGEEITVYVDADPNGVLPQLLFGQVGRGKGDWRKWQNLKPGKNVIKAPAGINPSALYVVNNAKPEDQAYAPRVRVEGGTAFPIYFHGETDPNEFYNELKEYTSKIEYNDEAFESDNPEGKVFNIAEFVSENCVITTSAKGALKGLDHIKGDNLTIYNTMEEWEEMYEMFQTFQGFEKNATDEKHSYFPNKFVSRVFTGVPLGFADHGYTGYLGSNNAERDGGFYKLIAMPPSHKDNDNWAYAHEFGHITNNRYMVDGDVTNNLYAQEYRRIKGMAGDRSNWNELFKRFKGEKFAFGFFERLGVLSQLNIAYGDDAYTKVSKSLRDNEKLIASIEGSDLRRLAVAYSLGLNVNLLDFFEGWGYTDVTPAMEDAVKHLPKPDKKIEYLHGGAYGYKGTGFNENLKLDVTSKINEEGKTNTLTFNIDDENRNDVLGYEILKDGEVIGFSKDNSFKVKDINTSQNETYEVRAYAKDLTTSDSIVINSFAPILKSYDKVTLKLNEEFDAKEYVKATNYLGESITDIGVKHNVDTKIKGLYTIDYSATSNGQTTTTSTEVEVVSDYDYLSDEAWKLVETDWGTPRRNSNIKGRINGDVKEFEKGFGIHANGKITYDLSDKDYDRFEALLGVDTGIAAQNNSSITFKIVGDGKTLATTKVLKHADDMVYVNVDVKGVKELVIEINDGGNGTASDHAVIANPKLITNNAKPKLTTEDKTYKLGEEVDFMSGVKANDAEDGDLTSKVEVASSNYEKGKTGRFEVVYRVTDKDNNVVEKKSYITIYEDFVVNKSNYGKFDNLDKYNEEFKLNVSSVSNNAGNYPGSPIGNAIDGNVNTHWETNKQNSDTFKNEVTFDLGESKEISKIAYKPRNGGKGFAKKFEIYTSNEAEGNDFILSGKGEYNGNINDVVEFNISKTTARRVMLKFVEANQDWAAIGEMSFYKEDVLAHKIANNLFTDSTKTEVAEVYNTLEKLETLREEVKNHPAVKLFEEDLNKAEQIIKAKYPTLKGENTVHNIEEKVNILDGITAIDKDGTDITSQIKIKSSDYKEGRLGKFTVVYTVTDSAGLTSEMTREIFVTNEETQLSSLDWKSATIGSGSVRKDRSVSGNALRLLDENGNVETFEKGIGTHSHSEIIYNSEGYDVLDTWVGVDQTVADKDSVIAGNAGTVEFSVYVDGKKVASSGVMKADTPKKHMIVDVAVSKEVKLVVEQATNGNNWDHANWADAKFHKMVKMERANLEATLEEAEKLDLNNYSDKTIEALEEAIAKGKEALEIDNQELIDTATEILRNAIDSLVEINKNEVVSIPDKYLVKSIQQALNKTGDITIADMRSLTTLTLSGVENLTGMEYARNLETLSMDYNEVKDLRPLANLKKLKNLDAKEQLVAAGELYPSNGKVVADSKVYNREGKNVAKTVRLVDKFGATVIEKDAEDEFVIDTKGLKEGIYGVHVLFEDEGFNGMVFYLFDI